MQSSTKRRSLLASVASGGVAMLAGCTSMTPFVGQRLTSHATHSPTDAEVIRVLGNTGSIDIRGTAQDDVSIDIVKQSSSARSDLDELSLVTEEIDGVLEIRSEYAGDVGRFESQPSMDLDIEIPQSIPVERVETSIGRINITAVTGDIDVETTTGRVSIADVSGSVNAQAETGRIDIRDVDQIGNVSSTTGRISVDIPALDDDTSISAITGRVEVAVDPAIDADIRASTSTGRVTVEGLDIDIEEERNGFLLGTIGDGGPELRLQTNTGRITIGQR